MFPLATVACVVAGQCPVDTTSTGSLIIDWPESDVGNTSIACPCGNITGLLQGRAVRQCLPGPNQAEWQIPDVSQCLTLDFSLCNISQVVACVHVVLVVAEHLLVKMLLLGVSLNKGCPLLEFEDIFIRF